MKNNRFHATGDVKTFTSIAQLFPWETALQQ